MKQLLLLPLLFIGIVGIGFGQNDLNQKMYYDTTIQTCDYDWETDLWLIREKESITFNSLGKVSQKISEDFDWAPVHYDKYKTEYQYDASGLLTTTVSSDWDGSIFVISGRNNYTYNSNNQCITRVSEEPISWGSPLLLAGYEVNYTYDGSFNLLEQRSRYADPLGDFSNSDWKISEYTNDLYGNPAFVDYDVFNMYSIVNEASFYYDINQSLDSVLLDVYSWFDDFPHRREYKYSISNLSPIEYIEGIPRMNRSYDSQTSQQFINRDANMNVVEEMSYQWDGSSWLNWRKFTSTYDGNNNLIQEFGEEWNGTDWINYSLIDHCLQISGIAEGGIINQNVNVYPNPTSDQITIDIKGYNGVVNVEVYDLQGRLLETTSNTKVSLKKHAKGIYVLKVSYGEITEEVRVVRE
jgi:hypothetical protein